MSHPVQKKARVEAKELCIARPDDFHLHVRDGDVLQSVVPSVAHQFGRAIIMPNLVPPVTTTELALAYRDRVLAAVPKTSSFIPLMTLYLTDTTTPDEIKKAKASGHVYAVKLYPAGATTNSDSGVTDIEKCIPTLKAMADVGLPLLIHGEVTDQDVDVFDREAKFLETKLPKIVKAAPKLKIVLEHITTQEAVDYVLKAPDNIAATITAHHLLFNRTKIFTGGIHPEYYCLPIIKAEEHRRALVRAATSGSPKFFLGTDSAPHPTHKKECCGGSAGCYTSFAAIELYAEAFEAADCLDKLEAFASIHGANFYGLPTNKSKGLSITLRKETWTVPSHYALGKDKVTPVKAGETLGWKCVQS